MYSGIIKVFRDFHNFLLWIGYLLLELTFFRFNQEIDGDLVNGEVRDFGQPK